MGMRPRLATVARQRGHIALLVLHDAAQDTVIDLAEQRTLRAALEDWQSATEAADVADGFGEAIGRGVGTFGDERYLLAWFEEYRRARDEVPLDVA